MIGPLVAFGLLALAPKAFDVDLRRQLLLRGDRPGRPALLRREPRGAARGREARRAPSRSRGGHRPAAHAALRASWSWPARRWRFGDRRATVSSISACSAGSNFNIGLLPAALCRHLTRLPDPGRARRAARRPHRARARAASAATRCCSSSTRRCCCRRSARPRSSSASLLLGAYYAATDGVLMALASAVAARGAARERAGAADDRDRPGAVSGLGPLRRALDVAGRGDGRRRLRRRPARGHRAGRHRACSHREGCQR